MPSHPSPAPRPYTVSNSQDHVSKPQSTTPHSPLGSLTLFKPETHRPHPCRTPHEFDFNDAKCCSCSCLHGYTPLLLCVYNLAGSLRSLEKPLHLCVCVCVCVSLGLHHGCEGQEAVMNKRAQGSLRGARADERQRQSQRGNKEEMRKMTKAKIT